MLFLEHTTYEVVLMDEDLPLKIIHVNTKSEAMKQLGLDVNQVQFIPPHWHRSLEFTYVREGQLNLRTSETVRTVKAGEFLIVNSSTLHEVSNVSGFHSEVICLLISYDFLKKNIPHFDNLRFEMKNHKESNALLMKHMERICETFEEGLLYNSLEIHASLYEILYQLVTYHQTDMKVTSNKDAQLLKEIIEFIHKNYQHPLTLNDLSKTFYMTREHFSRIFKNSMGITFLEYLNSYRIYRAFADIVYTKDTIETIALRHGFPNVKSFIHQFKLRYGTTPGKYRKNNNISIIDHNTSTIRQQ